MRGHRIEFFHRTPDIGEVRLVVPLVDERPRLAERVVGAPVLAARVGKRDIGLVSRKIVKRFRDPIQWLYGLPEPVSIVIIVGGNAAPRIGVSLFLAVLVVTEMVDLDI